jgi:hypothetical protein
MRRPVHTWMIFCVGLLALLSCQAPAAPVAPPSSVPVAEPSDHSGQFEIIQLSDRFESVRLIHLISLGTPDDYNLETNDPCKSIIALDREGMTDEEIEARFLVDAYERHPEDGPILWTFGVNFDVITSAGNPLGCLRLYLRNSEYGTGNNDPPFYSIDEGGIFVHTCRVLGDVELDAGLAIFPNTAGTPTADVSGIECAISLGEWLKELADPLGVGELENFDTPTIHTYSNFTIAAAFTVPPVSATLPLGDGSLDDEEDDAFTVSPVNATLQLPIVYYAQEEPGLPSLSLWAHVNNDREDAAGTLITTLEFPQQCQDGNRPSFAVDKPQLWWYDVTAYGPNSQSVLSYAQRELTPNGSRAFCTVGDVPPIEFWIGPTTLLIGAAPNAENTFVGSIDGILIDPTNSKPMQ